MSPRSPGEQQRRAAWGRPGGRAEQGLGAAQPVGPLQGARPPPAPSALPSPRSSARWPPGVYFVSWKKTWCPASVGSRKVSLQHMTHVNQIRESSLLLRLRVLFQSALWEAPCKTLGLFPKPPDSPLSGCMSDPEISHKTTTLAVSFTFTVAVPAEFQAATYHNCILNIPSID